MSKVSVIIPFMEADEGKKAILERLLNSLVGADEILVIDNDRAGYAVPINFGLSQASGDYLMILNDDLVMDKGDFHDLCDPDYVTSPTIEGNNQEFWGCAFMLPRWVYKKLGGMDERYRVSYFDDDDLMNELRKAKVPMKCIDLVNFTMPEGGGRTLHTFPDHASFFEENKQKFMEKWGYTPQEMTSYWNQFGKLPSYQAI